MTSTWVARLRTARKAVQVAPRAGSKFVGFFVLSGSNNAGDRPGVKAPSDGSLTMSPPS